MLKNIIINFKSKILYICRYIVKPIFYIHHFVPVKLDYKWEDSNSDRIIILNEISDKINAKRYLEIGCDLNQVFNKINCENKVGVDPSRGGTIRDTSDNFFKTNKEKFDLIFIDGLHTYDQILKDFKNSFDCLNDGGYIVMHDLMPRTWLEEHVPRISNDWCGDVWKISFLLNDIKDHDYKLLLTDFGLGVFRKKNNKIKINDFSYKNINFKYFVNNYKLLPLIDRDQFVEHHLNL